MVRTRILVMLQCDIGLDTTLGSRLWRILGLWITIVWRIIQIQHGSVEIVAQTPILTVCTWPRRWDLGSRSWHHLHVPINAWFRGYYALIVLFLEALFLSDLPCANEFWITIVWNRSNKGVRSCGLDKMWTDKDGHWLLYIPLAVWSIIMMKLSYLYFA